MQIISNYRLFIGLLAVLLAGRAWATPVVVTVTDSDTGQFVTGATIARLVGDMRTKTGNVLQTTPTAVGSTDIHGQIQIDCDPANRSAFLVTANGKTPRTFGFWGCVPATYRLTLSKATAAMSGRIIDGEGKPITDATVRVCLYDCDVLAPIRVFSFPCIGFTLEGRTDHAGRFTIPSAPVGELINITIGSAGNWHSVVAMSDYSEYSDVLLALHNGSFLGRMTSAPLAEDQAVPRPAKVPSLTLHLRVLDAETNRPIDNVRVSPGGAMSPDQFFRTLSRSALDLPGDDVTWSFYDGAWAYFLRVEADGYASAPTRIVKASEKHAELELKLSKATTATVSVRTPDGQPAAKARAYLATPTMTLSVPLGAPQFNDAQPIAVAGTDGIIRFSPPAEPYRLAIFNSDGSAEVSSSTNKGNAVTLTPWASVSITVAAAGKPLAGAFVQPQSGFSEDLGCPINWGGDYWTDAAGHLTISSCRPGSFFLTTIAPTGEVGAGWSYLEARADLKPGEHLDWWLMTGKTTVRAALMEYPGYRWPILFIEPRGPAVNLPSGINQLPEKQRDTAVSQAKKTAPDAKAAESVIDDIDVRPGVDGSIAVAGLRPGTYVLVGFAERVDANDANTPSSRPAQPPSLHWYFTVPTSQPAALDLGAVSSPISDAPVLQIGQIVPDLQATTLSGKPFSLRAYRGQWVLLDFWGTWCGFCIAEEPSLKDAYEGWSRDGRLAMVSASVDDTAEQVRRQVAERQLPWTQIVLGPRGQTNVPQKFGVDGYPTIMLISPQGKLVETGLRGSGLRDALLKYLGPAAPPHAESATTSSK